ncbi:MAG: hypothetical protein K2H41_08050 [Acetatifactor sp.]|nr:hypothetical protein [Acetatifactor sp.]MDE6701693.1 hypothetical protein [Acetatifactor sp.]
MNPIAGLLLIFLDIIVGAIVVAVFLIMVTIATMKDSGSIAKKAFIILLVYVLLAVGTTNFLLYCVEPAHYRNHKADDAISRAIYEATGGTEIYYEEKDITSKGVLNYRYLFYEENEEQLAKMLKAANTVIQEENSPKIEIVCCVRIPSSGSEPVLSLSNYSDAEQEKAEYPSLQKLWIRGTAVSQTIYNIPETYQNLQGIKYLEICDNMSIITERDNIDWHEYFPDLETLEIIPEEPYN